MDLTERRPVDLNAVPTLDHEVVDLTRAVGRLTEHNVQLLTSTTTRTIVDDLVVAKCFKRSLPGECQNLPQCHSERPNVTLTCELVLPKHKPQRLGLKPTITTQAYPEPADPKQYRILFILTWY